MSSRNVEIKVLGSGCAKCVKTAELIEKVAATTGVAATIEKVSDPQVMLAHDVMSTPAVVVNDKLVHSGSIPKEEQIKQWLTAE